jgi:hypothetical protein
LGACQIQQLREDATRLQSALIQRLQGLILFKRCAMAGKPRLQHQGGQGRAQLMGHVGGKASLTFDLGLQAMHQAIDGLHRHGQFSIRLMRHQDLAGIDVKRRDLARQTMQRQQAAPNGRSQHQSRHGQKQQSGQQNVFGDVGGQRITPRRIHEHGHAAHRGCIGRLGHIHAPILRDALHREAKRLVAQRQARGQLGVYAMRIPNQAITLPNQHMEFRGIGQGRMLAQCSRHGCLLGRIRPWQSGLAQSVVRGVLQGLTEEQLRSGHQQAIADFFGLVVTRVISQPSQQQPQRQHRTQGPGPEVAPQRTGWGCFLIRLGNRVMPHQATPLLGGTGTK